jgi:hypothetical protein
MDSSQIAAYSSNKEVTRGAQFLLGLVGILKSPNRPCFYLGIYTKFLPPPTLAFSTKAESAKLHLSALDTQILVSRPFSLRCCAPPPCSGRSRDCLRRRRLWGQLSAAACTPYASIFSMVSGEAFSLTQQSLTLGTSLPDITSCGQMAACGLFRAELVLYALPYWLLQTFW